MTPLVTVEDSRQAARRLSFRPRVLVDKALGFLGVPRAADLDHSVVRVSP